MKVNTLLLLPVPLPFKHAVVAVCGNGVVLLCKHVT
jgi:hypothetical protein